MTRKPWTPAQDSAIRSLFPSTHNQTLADLLGRTEPAIVNRAAKLGLRKLPEYIATNGTRFKPGIRPWNTGFKGWQAGGRSAQTRFQLGRAPEEARNYQPIGSLRLSKDGYLERKVNDRRDVAPARRWESVHRLVWVAAHGPLPPGHIVIFRPGMKTAQLELITPDRLECISRAENARRNHPSTKSTELGRLVQLKGAIARQVNRINKEAREAATA